MSDTIQSLRVDSLTVHPAAGKIPRMRQEEWAPFLADVLARGVQEPIVVSGSVVLDGRHRIEAARVREDATIEARLVDLTEDEQVAYAVKAALHRRHLSDSQRAMLGAELKTVFAEAAKERQVASGKEHGRGREKVVENLPQPNQGKARDHAAAIVNVSGKSIDHAAKVLRSGADVLVQAVTNGHVPVSVAAKLADLPKREQTRAVQGGKPAIKEAIRKAEPAAKISETFYRALSDIRARLSGIRDQYGSVSEMFDSDLWRGCDIHPVIEMTGMLAKLLTEMHKEMREHESKRKS